MNTSEIVEAIDQEISKLQQARALLAEVPAIQAAKPAAGKRRGRPKGSVNKKAEVIAPVVARKTRAPLSAEGKARIAAAQKARWAVQKKAEAKAAAKKITPKAGKKAVSAAKPAAKKIASKLTKRAAIPAKKSVAEPVVEA